MTEAKSSGLYKKLPFDRGTGKGVTLPGQNNKKIVGVKHNLPGSIILVHGVNDIGVSYDAVESGLCEGLAERLCGDLTPGTYRMPQTADRDKLEEDPDAIFYKRQITDETHSPVIPFYWGFREESTHVKDWRKTPHGQAVDRFGNRLDRDYSKEGGPFANATTSLVEMWNRGKSDAMGTLDLAAHDATHPLLKCPGRLYMILAARRLAALISMIRDYDEDETVSIVAHSQGCLISLLAQAFLLDTNMQKYQPGARPADTLILCNPPYSLIDELPTTAALADGHAGQDSLMTADRYQSISGVQTLHARLTTLANIVNGVHAKKHKVPKLAELADTKKHLGAVGPKWTVTKDRDNRGKVYLYFSPEDMTVAFAGVAGIGWQGVPDFQRGHRIESRRQSPRQTFAEGVPLHGKTVAMPMPVTRRPLSELGDGFFQRVFTLKRRPDFRNGQVVLVGQAPHDFALRVADEDDHAHTAASDSWTSNHALRQHLPSPGGAPNDASSEERARFGLRRITGEALPKPIVASMGEGASPDAQNRFGASEKVDQIDAAVSVTSDYGIDGHHWECIADPAGVSKALRGYQPVQSPRPALHKGRVAKLNDQRLALTEQLNRDKKNEDKCEVKSVYVCLEIGIERPLNPPKLLIERTETPNEARIRWQKSTVSRSFHSAIYGGRKNHSHVTAYDVAIGGGKAPTHPLFYEYLCAVADWRLKKPREGEKSRLGILTWEEFLQKFAAYWADERPWRKALLEGNQVYYSTGRLPPDLPLPPEGLPPALVVESMSWTVVNAERVT
jgi:pimeloyl-ACP methyl ester carboxylesterase